MEENEKHCFRLDWSKKNSERSVWKSLNSMKNTWENSFKNTHYPNFDQSKLSLDQSRNRFNQSSTSRARQIQINFFITISISQETDSIDWKSGKLKFLKNRAIFLQNIPKTQYFMNEIHEYEIKSFSKTLEFNPDLPKIRFSTNFSPKVKH